MMVRRRAGAVPALLVLLGGLALLVPAAPAYAAGPCGDSETRPGAVIRALSSPQRVIGRRDRSTRPLEAGR